MTPDLPAARRVYETVDIRRQILQHLDPKDLVRIVTLEKAFFMDAASFLYRTVPFRTASGLQARTKRQRHYCESVRHVRCHEKERDIIYPYTFKLDEKLVIRLRKKFTRLRSISHKSKDTATTLRLADDGTGTMDYTANIREHCPRLKKFHITMSGLGHDGRVVTEQDLRLCAETYDGPLDEVNLTVGDVTAFQLPGLAIGRILPCLGKHTTHIPQSDARIARLRHVNFAELDIINVQQYRNIQFGPDGSLVRPPRDDVQHRWNGVVIAVDELQILARHLEKHLPALKDKAKEAVSRHVPRPDDFQVRLLIAQLRSSIAAHGPAVEAARELRDRLTSFIDAEDDLKDTLVEMDKRRQALEKGGGAENGE